MKEIKNRIYDELTSSYIDKQKGTIIYQCVIKHLNLDTFNPKVLLHIENCIIEKMNIYCAWFEGGLIFKNNIVKGYVNYEMGGHNKKPFIMDGNVFLGFIDFFDCQFDAEASITNNVFAKGTSLLGNKGQGFSNLFEHGYTIEGNVGKLDFDYEGQVT